MPKPKIEGMLEPIHEAALKGNLAEMERMIAAYGGNPDEQQHCDCLVDYMPTTGCTALMLAAVGGQEKAVKRLLEMGASVTRKDMGCNTALHWACMADQAKTMALLLDAGAPMNDRNEMGWTPLAQAENFNKDKCRALLIERGGQK
jgi:uncharacterized protein